MIQVDTWGGLSFKGLQPKASSSLIFRKAHVDLQELSLLSPAGCQNPQSCFDLTDAHSPHPGLSTLQSMLAWSYEYWAHSWHSEGKETPLPIWPLERA